MKQYTIEGKNGESKIILGEKIAELKHYLPKEKIIIITDKNLLHYYGAIISKYDFIVIGTGEDIKNIDTIQFIYNELLRLEANRSTFILGFGGGIVCDITGFAASTYMRGLRFGFVSTSLLSQVDASMGGKNGINLKGFKNIIGTFNQPGVVLCDLEVLKTLPEKEFISGFAEVIKHAIIADYEMFCFLETNFEKALKKDNAVLEYLISQSIEIKSSIVNIDETEQGIRRILNFGHSFGHAIERNSNLLHGDAVSIGMMMAANISYKKAMLSKEHLIRIEKLLTDFGLPTKCKIAKDILIKDIRKDKKRNSESIYFIEIKEIGKAEIENITIDKLENLI